MSDDRPSLFSPGVGKRGMTELHYAAYAGDINGLRRGLAAGLNVNAVDSYRGYTPLHWLADMAATGGPRLEMLDLLISSGADINRLALDGTTALVLAREAGSAGGDKLAAVLSKLART